MCLRSVLLPSSFQFLYISRSSNDEKHKGGQEGEGDVMVEVEVDEKW